MAIYKSKNSTKDGRQYFFRIKYKDIFGVTHDYTSKKFKTLKETQDEEARYRIKIQNKEVCTYNVTVEQIFYELLLQKEKQLKKQTIIKIKNLYKHLNAIKDKKINDINIDVYKNLIRHLDSCNLSSNYKNKILGLFKQIVAYSSKYYNTSDSVLKFVEKYKSSNEIVKEMKFFTYEEYLKFDKVIDIFDYRVFFEVLYFLGLRQGECTALTWKDVDFDKKVININKTLTTKIKGENWTISSTKTRGSTRTLPMTKKVYDDLLSMKNKAKCFNDYKDSCFVFGNSIPFKETTIQYYKNKYCDKAKLERIRVHDFRHSCASLLINQGSSIALVSKYLGHSNISITLNTYTHMFKNELESIVNVLNKL